jgi:lipid-binding SYLF domain-containing protein
MTLQNIYRCLLFTLGTAALIGIAGCRAVGGASGSNPAEQRSTIQSEAFSTLNELYAARPETRSKVKNAFGYAYFSNVNVNVLLLSTENGYGVVHNNATGKNTYMKMASGGVGVGMGLKDYRSVFIFTDEAVMRKFVDTGLDLGGSADVAAKTGTTGGAANVGMSASSVAGMEIYQFTKNGLALQATLQGTKYFRDDKLNR